MCPPHPWPAIWTTVQRYLGRVWHCGTRNNRGIAIAALCVVRAWLRWEVASASVENNRSRALSRCILVDVTLCLWCPLSDRGVEELERAWEEARGGQAGRGLAPGSTGGQTNTSTPDPPLFSANAIGHLFRGEARSRSTAKPSPRGRRRPLPCQHAGVGSLASHASSHLGSLQAQRRCGGVSRVSDTTASRPLITSSSTTTTRPKTVGSLHSISPGRGRGVRQLEKWLGSGFGLWGIPVWGSAFLGDLVGRSWGKFAEKQGRRTNKKREASISISCSLLTARI